MARADQPPLRRGAVVTVLPIPALRRGHMLIVPADAAAEAVAAAA